MCGLMSWQPDDGEVRPLLVQCHHSLRVLMMGLPRPADDVIGICEHGSQRRLDVAVPELLPAQTTTQSTPDHLAHHRRLAQIKPHQQIGSLCEQVAYRVVLPFGDPLRLGAELIEPSGSYRPGAPSSTVVAGRRGVIGPSVAFRWNGCFVVIAGLVRRWLGDGVVDEDGGDGGGGGEGFVVEDSGAG